MVKLRSGKIILNIISLNNNIIQCNKYIEKLGKKVLLNDAHYKQILNLNNQIYNEYNNVNIRKDLYEQLDYIITIFINTHKLNNKLSNKLNNKGSPDHLFMGKKCEICYLEICKNQDVNLCQDNNIIHIFHKECFNYNIIYSNALKQCMTDLYQCPYCLKFTIDTHKVYNL